MHLPTSAVLMTGLAATTVLGATAGHVHGPAGKRHNHAARHAEIMANQRKRDLDRRDTNLLSVTDSVRLTKLGFTSFGLNPTYASSTPWIGADGQFTNEFHNTAGQNITLVVWGPAGSWVNAVQPHLTISIPVGSNKTVSFPTGWSGAWSTVTNTTTLVNGQIYDTWGEATFAPPYSVVDVSREVNMGGRNMSIVGPTCTTDMNTCVFKCTNGAPSCWTEYELDNCATGSQAGANYGTFEGAASGGCGGMGSGAKLVTYLG